LPQHSDLIAASRHRAGHRAYLKPLPVAKAKQAINLTVEAFIDLAGDDQPVARSPRRLRSGIAQHIFGPGKEPDFFRIRAFWIGDRDRNPLAIYFIRCLPVERHREGGAPDIEARALACSDCTITDYERYRQRAAFRHADDVGASRPAGIDFDVHLLTWLNAGGDFQVYKESVLFLVDMVHEAADDKRFRHRRADGTSGDAGGELPFELERRACITGVQPVIMPARFRVHDNCDGYGITGGRAIRFGFDRRANILRRTGKLGLCGTGNDENCKEKCTKVTNYTTRHPPVIPCRDRPRRHKSQKQGTQQRHAHLMP